MKRLPLSTCIGAALLVLTASTALASSHREGLAIAATPQVDNTDVYAFNSYETGRQNFVTLIANFLPFQDPGGGPHFYPLDDEAMYSINVDNDGDAKADISFDVTFQHALKGIALNVGGQSVPIPILNPGPIGPNLGDTASLDRVETYEVSVRREGVNNPEPIRTSTGSSQTRFVKPVDNIGNKSIPNYQAYANQHIHALNIPGCATGGRIFVGQRKEGFVVNIGEIFDLVNLNPLGAVNAKPNSLRNKNITSIALEVPKTCLTAGSDPVIGVWSTASKFRVALVRSNGRSGGFGRGVFQVSRLGNPLVNEVVIGNPDKDIFNGSEPKDDAQFAKYVTNPVLPELIEVLFPVRAPNLFPRTDLVSVFLTGVPGLNKPANVVPSEMMRLNTTTPALPAASQNPLGVIGGDTAGYPNGRRPGDDVVDISLRVAMGALLTATQAPDGQLPYTDQAFVDAGMFDQTFPYLRTPLPGAPFEASMEPNANP